MCRKLIYLTIFFAFCSTAMASDIAISTQVSWVGQGTADAAAQQIVSNVTGVSVEVFPANQENALATWVQDHTGDGTVDLLILFGRFPSSIYPAGNAQPDGSIAEAFLDDGNCIINTGDYIFYVGTAANNDAGGLSNMMDVGGAAMWGDDSGGTTFTPTADGQLYTPSLTTLPTNRPWFPAQFAGTDWEVELILAQSSDGSQVHPAILHNTVTGGRLGVFFQWSDDSQPRGEVISEWINNYFMAFIAAGNPLARRPIPADGTIHTKLWVGCQWTPGDFAESHNVYFGDNFADVDAGTGGTFQDNVPLTNLYFFAGFDPYAYPDGLVPGTDYYWRIDAVKEGDPNSPWKGKVWSFSIPTTKAHDPVPRDGARFIDPDVTLSWTPGLNAVSHHVYFGDNPDDVAAGTPDTDKQDGPMATYSPGTLEYEKTYYWRIDEADGPPDYEVHQGDVWSFTVAKEGGGLMGDYYHWSGSFPPPNAFQVFVLSRIDPQVDFGWGDDGGDETLRGINSPDALVNVNLFACRWTGEVEAAFTETYTFYMVTDDGQRLWVDGELIIDHWVEQGDTEYSGTIDLVAGQRYSIVAEHYENGGGATARLRWSSPSTPKEAIPEAALSPPVRARIPSPPNGATGVSQMAVMGWSPGIHATSHEVYFGTDPDALTRVVTKSLGDESYDPGKLAWETTYYWRVDEANNLDPDSPWVGSLWSFTTADYLVVDDFEDYKGDEVSVLEQIWGVWRDGLGFGAVTAPPYSPGNGTGSEVGDGTTDSYTEETISHGGLQSMPYVYNNAKADKFKYSEAKMTLTAGLRDWTEEGIKALSLWFYGDPANAAERMYVAVANNTGLPGVVYHDDDDATQIDTWTEWNIDLKEFQDQGIDLADVNSIAIGFGDRNNPQVGGAGKMLFDDIALYRPRYVPGKGTPLAADLSSDGVVDYRDVRILAYQWLFEAEVVDWAHRVAYWDAAYPTGWAEVEVTEGVRDHLALNGYTVVNAAQLKTWMDARIADGAPSVVVFCKDIVPDTVAETMDANCTIRRYLDAGGKVVWYADWPIYYQGLSDGTSAPTWGGAGAENVLGLNASSGPNDTMEDVFITAAGTAWGLTQTWPSQRPTAPMAENLTALATITAGSAAGWAKHYVPGDYYRGFFRIADFDVGPADVADLLPNILNVAESTGNLAADLNGDDTVDFKDFAVMLNQWLEVQVWPEW